MSIESAEIKSLRSVKCSTIYETNGKEKWLGKQLVRRNVSKVIHSVTDQKEIEALGVPEKTLCTDLHGVDGEIILYIECYIVSQKFFVPLTFVWNNLQIKKKEIANVYLVTTVITYARVCVQKVCETEHIIALRRGCTGTRNNLYASSSFVSRATKIFIYKKIKT